MLSRTAEHLFWMTRHTGRADHLARLLEASYHASLLQIEEDDSAARSWLAILSIAGLVEPYRLAHEGIERHDVIAFMVADSSNPSSLVSCLRYARENARAVRGWASTELWESLNTTWLDLQRHLADGLHAHDPAALFEWIKTRTHLVRGVLHAAPLHDEAFDFLHLGSSVERADHMARTLEAHSDLLHADGFDYHRASALLSAVNAFDAYRRLYRETLSPERIATLLIQCVEWPGSLAASLDETRQRIARLRHGQSTQTERLAQQLADEVRHAPLAELLATGALDGWLTSLIVRVNELARRVGRDLPRPALPEPVAAAA